MNKTIVSFLLFTLSCGHSSENEASKVTTPNSDTPERKAMLEQGSTDSDVPKPGSPESANEIELSCKVDNDCSVIPSYCGGFTTVHTSSVVMARKHYDAIGQLKKCREGDVSPRPQAYCDNKRCEPTVWNEGYAIHFAESIDFQNQSSYEGEVLSPFPISREDKNDALIALQAALQLAHPDIVAKSTTYRAQYMGAKTKANKNPILLGNFFCRAGESNWQTNWVVVDDGGPCYFQFKFDLETKKLIELTVNGEA